MGDLSVDTDRDPRLPDVAVEASSLISSVGRTSNNNNRRGHARNVLSFIRLSLKPNHPSPFTTSQVLPFPEYTRSYELWSAGPVSHASLRKWGNHAMSRAGSRIQKE